MSSQQKDQFYNTLQDDRDNLPMQIHSELDDFPLSTEAFRVYAHLVRRAGKSRKAWPSYQHIDETCFRASYPNAASSTLKIKAIDAVRELVVHRLINKFALRAVGGVSELGRINESDLRWVKKEFISAWKGWKPPAGPALLPAQNQSALPQATGCEVARQMRLLSQKMSFNGTANNSAPPLGLR